MNISYVGSANRRITVSRFINTGNRTYGLEQGNSKHSDDHSETVATTTHTKHNVKKQERHEKRRFCSNVREETF